MSKAAEIFVRMDQELLTALKSEADKCSISLSAIVRMILIGERAPIRYEVVTDAARTVIQRLAAARSARRTPPKRKVK